MRGRAIIRCRRDFPNGRQPEFSVRYQLRNGQSYVQNEHLTGGLPMNKYGGGAGFGLGVVIAVALSWGANHSILWAIVHGFLSWFYIIYYFIFK